MRKAQALAALSIFSLALLPRPATGQDEPGLAPGAPPPAPPPPSPSSVLDRARTACLPLSGCPLLGELLALLGDPNDGPAAAQLLATSGDARAAGPLALAAVYGPPALQQQAASALRTLAAAARARPAVLRMAQTDPDPQLRRLAGWAITGDPGGLSTPPTTVVARPAAPARLETGTDPDTARVIYGPTAYQRPRGVWSFTSHDLGLWQFDYGITDNVQVTLSGLLPIGVIGFYPQLRFGGALSEKVRLGVNVGGAVFYPYMENGDSWRVGLWGGGPVLTIGSPRLLFNVGLPVYGLTVGRSEHTYYGPPGYTSSEEIVHDTTWMIIPNLGFSAQVSRRIKLNLELHTPLGDHGQNGKLWLILYGMRIVGERIFGDISFVIPAYPGADAILKYVPIGFPLLSFGFQW